MRKILLGLVATAAIASPIAVAASANAATTDVNGVVTVTKGDIQSAMGWNNAKWDAAIAAPNGVANVGNLITTSHGNTPVFNNGGWLTLNGQIVADYPNDEYWKTTMTEGGTWCPLNTLVESSVHWTGGVDTAVTPIVNANNKVTGYKVSAAAPADGYVLWTNHATFDCDGNDLSWERNMTSRWPASLAGSGVSDVKVDGKPVTVSPYVAPTV